MGNSLVSEPEELKRWVKIAYPKEDFAALDSFPYDVLAGLYPEVVTVGPAVGKICELEDFFERAYEVSKNKGVSARVIQETLYTLASMMSDDTPVTSVMNHLRLTYPDLMRGVSKRINKFELNTSVEGNLDAKFLANYLACSWTLVDLKIEDEAMLGAAKSLLELWAKSRLYLEAVLKIQTPNTGEVAR